MSYSPKHLEAPRLPTIPLVHVLLVPSFPMVPTGKGSEIDVQAKQATQQFFGRLTEIKSSATIRIFWLCLG